MSIVWLAIARCGGQIAPIRRRLDAAKPSQGLRRARSLVALRSRAHSSSIGPGGAPRAGTYPSERTISVRGSRSASAVRRCRSAPPTDREPRRKPGRGLRAAARRRSATRRRVRAEAPLVQPAQSLPAAWGQSSSSEPRHSSTHSGPRPGSGGRQGSARPRAAFHPGWPAR